MGPGATFGQLLHRVTLDAEHRVETWRYASGDVVVLLVNRQGEALHHARMPRPLRRSRWMRRLYRARVVRRWVLDPDVRTMAAC